MAPKPLSHSSLPLLEFGRMREVLRGYAASPLGQARAQSLEPTADAGWVLRQQQLTAEVRGLLRTGGNFDFAGLFEPAPLLERSRIAGVALETAELRDLLLVVDRASGWRSLSLQPPSAIKDAWRAVSELSSGIADFAALLDFFRDKFAPDGTLDDRASPALKQLRREVEKQKRAIQDSLRSQLRRLSESGIAQEEIISVRGERFVIPVKAEHKRKIAGVLHGSSSSGQTVFLEPLETIEQNNELVRLREEEQAEIHRILLQMTEQIGSRAAEIGAAAAILGELELQFAKARFAEEHRCVQPQISQSGSFFLYKARHPLLERNLRGKGGAVVAITLELEDSARQVIISGPNTGGKTVALKTVGLLALMHQAGIPVPAERAQLPVFRAILADIGDYQSIEQNLSTFSAHITNIDLISRNVSADSLVLLDELGSATDPEEGAALAVAIAAYFLQRGCLSIISTHHTSLKVYAANTAGVVNAAVGFDERTLQPTYELRMGVPGASAGINIAQRLQLNEHIIQAARERLSSQTQEIASFLDRLHSQLRQLEQERAAVKTREQEVAREKQRLETHGLREQRSKVAEMEKKLEGVLRDFEYRAREVVSEVADRAAAQKMSKQAERRIASLRREFKEQFDSAVVAHHTGADTGDPHARLGVVQNAAEGDTVRLKSLGRNAVITRRLEGDLFEVQAGNLKMRVPRGDIAEVVSAAGNPLEAARARGIRVQVAEEESVPSELNVIGENVDEATRRVEKFLDRAFLAGLPRVRIVHGSGMGVLRKALRKYLREHPQVAAVSEPPHDEGGGGATVVELRV